MNSTANGIDQKSRGHQTGIARKVDDLGRIVLPVELRRAFDIREGDLLEVSTEDGRILLSKRQDSCTFCSSEENLSMYRERRLCQNCKEEIQRL